MEEAMPSRTVKIHGIPIEISESQIKKFFSDIEHVELRSENDEGKRSQTAYVTFKDEMTAHLFLGATLEPEYKLPVTPLNQLIDAVEETLVAATNDLNTKTMDVLAQLTKAFKTLKERVNAEKERVNTEASGSGSSPGIGRRVRRRSWNATPQQLMN